MARPEDLIHAEKKRDFSEFRAEDITFFIEKDLTADSGELEFVIPGKGSYTVEFTD
ncbi:MAG TPA: hypothetical protein VKO43_02045 [Candidatus Krumholzibacteriaceae bacterium]|nr:hypothetical protein [Candidatus Krumholzibacteriaceae bacterium]